jgi:hypothetical protein
LRWLLPFASVVIALGVLEIGIRAVGHYDEDGNFYVRWNRLRPYHLPVNRAERLAAAAEDPRSQTVYHPQPGWIQRPDGTNWSASGVRLDPAAPIEPAAEPDPGVLRIALFGDSFTESSVVSQPESWGRRLQDELTAAGITNEVLNLGCGGYGMDQALLRWRLQGRALKPQVVLFGFQPENLARNLNLVRLIYQHESGIPFTKPRFVLQPDGSLQLIHSPPALPDEVPAILASPESWPWIRHEHFYRAADYRPRFWQASKLACYAQLVLADIPAARRESADWFAPDGEAGRLGLAIVGAFAGEVRATGAQFVVVHLPSPESVAATARGKTLPQAAILDRIERLHPMIRPDEAIQAVFAQAGLAGLMKDGHYSAPGEAAIGRSVAAQLPALLTRRP